MKKAFIALSLIALSARAMDEPKPNRKEKLLAKLIGNVHKAHEARPESPTTNAAKKFVAALRKARTPEERTRVLQNTKSTSRTSSPLHGDSAPCNHLINPILALYAHNATLIEQPVPQPTLPLAITTQLSPEYKARAIEMAQSPLLRDFVQFPPAVLQKAASASSLGSPASRRPSSPYPHVSRQDSFKSSSAGSSREAYYEDDADSE